MQSTTGTTGTLLVSLFPSGRMVLTAPSGRTVSSTLGYERLLEQMRKDIPEGILKEFVWNERMFQISERAIATLVPADVIEPQAAKLSKKISLWPASWPRFNSLNIKFFN